MTIDKEFEAWALNHEIDITKNPAPSYDSRLYNDDETDNMWIGWQAARAIDAKRIAELEKDSENLRTALASIRDIFEFDDAMVNSGALSYPEAVAGFVKTKVAELQAREKVLVDLLGECVDTVRNEYNEMLELYSSYQHKQYDIQCQKQLLNGIEQALANVRGEVK